MNSTKSIYEKSFHLHRMNDNEDLNLYYKKFLNKLSKISLKIFLPLLTLIYLFTLFLCRLFLFNQTKLTFDLRTILAFTGIFFTIFLLFLVRLHTKWKTLWFFTRILLISLVFIPLILTYQTNQYHILFSTISITLIYSLLTFTLIQSLIISLSISILHLSLFYEQNSHEIHWKTLEFLSLILYHLIINLAGLYMYIKSIKHIRKHFHLYEENLYEKNQSNVNCKKLNTIIGYCQQSQRFNGRLSKISNGLNINNLNRKFGTVIYCNLSLNEQTRIHTCDEFASLIDVLYCQIEELIIKYEPQAKYIFDNETIMIILLNEDNNEEKTIDFSCRLAIELFRFIQHVNNVTQWCLTLIIGIDYNQLNIYSNEYIQGLAYDSARWLCEECLISNRIHISSKIYNQLKENKFYEFHSYSWLTNKHFLENDLTYFLFSTNMYEINEKNFISMNHSSMIDQLTRIQAQYHVEKHLGTITLTRSLRKRSLIELTNQYLHWFSLNFKSSAENFHIDFQSTHRIQRPDSFFYLFLILILISSLIQSFVLRHITLYYLITFPTIIFILIFLICLFVYLNRFDSNQMKTIQRTFNVYLNKLICLTLATLFLVAGQYHAIENFQYLLNFNRTNRSSSQLNETKDELKFFSNQSSTSLFDRQYHDYLVLSPIYALYLCTIYRQCSWILKTCFILSCLIVQLCLFEYIWLTTHNYFPSINSFHHYTIFTLIILHSLLLILSTYVKEWLEKLDFVWLKQIDSERLIIQRQCDELIKQASFYFPIRVINYYLRNDSNLVLSQHYHVKYEQMGLLYVKFDAQQIEDEYLLIEFLNDIEYLLKTNENYIQIVMHRKCTMKELLFSIDLQINESNKSLQNLVEFLFQLDQRLKQNSLSKIHFSACLHIGCVNEVLIHFEKSPKIDLWSDHLSLMQILNKKIPINHCLTTSSVYQYLNEIYLFRTAGSIQNTQIHLENQTNIYYLLGRLIGENIFQGRNTLPLTIHQSNTDTVQKSSSTDDSQKEQHHIQTSTTTTTSSSGNLNEQQSLLKQSSRKHVRISNHLSSIENPSYRQTLLQALNNSTNHQTQQQQLSPIKKFSNRFLTKKSSSPSVSKDFYVPRMIHLSDNSCFSSREAMTQSETSGSKCLILTQQMLNGSTDDNSQCKSTPPPPFLPSVPSSTNRQFSNERKSFTEEDFRQLLQEKSSAKDSQHPSRSLSTTNEETASSFSGWDDIPSSPISSVKSNHGINPIQQDSVKSPLVDCYYPRRPCDLSFTVNMTTEDDTTSSRTDTKSTVIASPTSTVVTITSPQTVNLAKPAVVSSPSTTNLVKPIVVSLPPPPQTPPPQQQHPVQRYRQVPFNLARKLVAETSESALSDLSIDHHYEPWMQNIVYQSKHPHGARLSSSYSNLHDLIHLNESSKYLPKTSQSPTLVHSDLLQRWLEDQLNLFRHQIKQTPPLSTRKTNRLSTNVMQNNDSTDDESDTVSENTFTPLTNQSKINSTNHKRPYNHVKYRPLRKNGNQTATSHLVRHESLKHRNRPLSYEHMNAQISETFLNYPKSSNKKVPHRTDSASMPRSDLSDISSSRPDNLSESVISNLESEYDNIFTQSNHPNLPTTIMSNSQILSDDEEDDDDDDDDETTLATTITTKSRCYF